MPAATYKPVFRHGHIERVFVWDHVVRVTHWVIVASIAVLSVTGLYIGNPFIIPETSTPSFLMGWMRAIHFATAIAFTLAVAARIVWMFTGPPFARWWNFLPAKRERIAKIPGTIKFYMLMLAKPPAEEGHNPVAGLAYMFVFMLYLVMIVSGLGLYAVDAHVDSPLRACEPLLAWFGGAQAARWYHHVVMWLLIGFAVHHIYSALLVSSVEKNGEMDSMFSGYKWVSRENDEQAAIGNRERRRDPSDPSSGDANN